MDWRQEEILIIVKVYPSPSKKYGEIVCTAGITKGGKWIRIYPVPYRDLPFTQRFVKFQWISAKVAPSKEKLSRPESHNIDASSIKLLKQIPPGTGWKEREKYFYPAVSKSLEELLVQQKGSGVSLGAFKPKLVKKFIIKSVSGAWDSKKQGIVGQMNLFSNTKTPLQKIPYTFHYEFICDDSRCQGHNLIILDWETSESYRKFKDIYKDEGVTLQKLNEKWLDYFFKKRESYFVVGTDSEFNKFMILTVVSPRRKEEV